MEKPVEESKGHPRKSVDGSNLQLAVSKQLAMGRRIFLGNIPYSCSCDEVEAAMSAFGPVFKVVIPVHAEATTMHPSARGSINNLGFAFVEFYCQSDAAEAIKAASTSGGLKLKGRKLRVEFQQSSAHNDGQNNRLGRAVASGTISVMEAGLSSQSPVKTASSSSVHISGKRQDGEETSAAKSTSIHVRKEQSGSKTAKQNTIAAHRQTMREPHASHAINSIRETEPARQQDIVAIDVVGSETCWKTAKDEHLGGRSNEFIHNVLICELSRQYSDSSATQFEQHGVEGQELQADNSKSSSRNTSKAHFANERLLKITHSTVQRFQRHRLRASLRMIGLKPAKADRVTEKLFDIFERQLHDCMSPVNINSSSEVDHKEALSELKGELQSGRDEIQQGKSVQKNVHKQCLQITRKAFTCAMLMALSLVGHYNVRHLLDFDVACSIREQRLPLVVLLGGTSGTGKSTLSTLLAGRLGISTVLSTDFVRHMLRMSFSKSDNPILWHSTYNALEVEDTRGRDEMSAEQCGRPLHPSVSGYVNQRTVLESHIETVVKEYVARNESIIVEGVHLGQPLINRLVKVCPTCFPFVVYISNQEKHKERFAVRAKFMTLDPDSNRYVKYFSNIRRIQKFICEQADDASIPKIDNTNVDRSVSIVHSTVVSALRKWIKGKTSLSDQYKSTGKMSALLKIYEKRILGNWSSKQMLRAIQSSKIEKAELFARYFQDDLSAVPNSHRSDQQVSLDARLAPNTSNSTKIPNPGDSTFSSISQGNHTMKLSPIHNQISEQNAGASLLPKRAVSWAEVARGRTLNDSFVPTATSSNVGLQEYDENSEGDTSRGGGRKSRLSVTGSLALTGAGTDDDASSYNTEKARRLVSCGGRFVLEDEHGFLATEDSQMDADGRSNAASRAPPGTASEGAVSADSETSDDSSDNSSDDSRNSASMQIMREMDQPGCEEHTQVPSSRRSDSSSSAGFQDCDPDCVADDEL